MAHSALIAEIEAWLVDKALADPDVTKLFEALCERLFGVGIPLERAALSWPTLHPLFQAEQVYWGRGDGARLIQMEHSDDRSQAWLSSPFYHVLTHSLSRLRRRLTGPEALVDFPVLEELQEQGFTDYLMTRATFKIAEFRAFEDRDTGILASWSTKREDGFSSADITALSHIQKLFAVACRIVIQRRVMANVANTYLGPTAGWRVLSGAIRRSDGEKIPAVIWYSDLRGSTQLAERMDPGEYLKVLNTYFECTAGPVIAHGGEVLDFIGDAVLAIFPIESDIGRPDAIRRATAAMEEALRLRDIKCEECRVDERPPGFGIALAVGEVMFGNIGVPERLAFSVIGRMVNAVHRIDQATKALEEPVLVTEDIAALEPQRWLSVGSQKLNDVSRPVQLFKRRPTEEAASEPVDLATAGRAG